LTSVREPLALAVLRRLAERGGRSGWVHTPAGSLRYTVRGPAGATPLLVVHGLGDSIPGWARAAPALAARHRLHLIDLPGHGLSSEPPDYRLQTLLRAVEAYALSLDDQPLLVGHSLGGWLALRLLLRHPGLARGLVLVNPTGASLPAEEFQEFAALLQPEGARDVWRYLDRAFHRAPLALRLVPGEVIKAMRAPSAQGLLGSLGEGDFLLADELRAVRTPIRLLWGRHDRFLPASTLPFFRAHLPHAEVVLLERAGHCPHLEAPTALARAILAPLPRLG
jgi:pimeloyl-ACP methyl ester carboxylesterase